MKIKCFFAVVITVVLTAGCASAPRTTVVELENKGTAMGLPTPNWIRTYTAYGISRVQAQPEFKDVYCVIGEETGVNRQFVLAWADNFSAQQRIGAMLRTNITSAYQAHVTGEAQSQGRAGSQTASGSYDQEIRNIINSVVEVTYSGVQREADWWSLRRRYDPDREGVYNDEYTAYVLYTIPRSQLDFQIARALEVAVSADSELYEITIQIARQIMLGGFNYLGEGDLTPAEVPPQTTEEKREVNAAGSSGNITIRNNSSALGSIMTMVKIFAGFEPAGEPLITYNNPVLGGQQVSWDLPEGAYTVEVFMNNMLESILPGLVGSGRTTVGVTAGSNLFTDFLDGFINSFIRR